MAAEASRSGGGPADSYIGSLISLTSKFEIRYEGVLYNINTEESSIGLRNVRSFGTEGRKDGPQIPPSDKVYEYILFRGSDIKDLQVKSSPPVQTTPPPPPPIHNDPAIIQSHYPRPTSASSSLASVANGTVADPTSHSAQLGLPRSPFQGGLPLYQPGGSFGSWASSAAPQNGSGLPMPMYWQGFYAPSSALPPLQQQQPLIRPPPGLPIPQSMQQQPMQYPSISMNASSLPTGVPNLIDFTSPLLPPVSNTSSTSVTLPSTLAPVQASALTSEALSSMVPNKAPITSLPATTSSANLPLVSPLTSSSVDMNAIVPPISSKPRTASGPSLAYQTTSQSVSSIIGPSTSGHAEALVPPLVTPGQLLQPGTTTLSSSQPLQTSKDVEAVQPVSSEPSSSAPAEVQAPILPLPRLPDNKMNGAGLQNRHYNRGHERGRGNGVSRGVTQFTEDFDFMAMNEKFNKDEVWGHLGKSKVRDKEGEARDDDADDTLEQYVDESSRFDIKPVYVKDEFFDSLSCNALDQGTRNGRTRFSEQLKIDTETFGDFPRHRGRGGRGPGRGGGRSRGPFYGRGYGYVGRGRGHTLPYRVNYS